MKDKKINFEDEMMNKIHAIVVSWEWARLSNKIALNRIMKITRQKAREDLIKEIENIVKYNSHFDNDGVKIIDEEYMMIRLNELKSMKQ